MDYQELLDDFTAMCQDVYGDGLTGVYLHGSMAMGCFHAEKSDIDLIVVVEDSITDAQKMRFMEQVVRLNGRAPAKGLELSVVKREYCRPFLYPTPYELHFSNAHLQWFLKAPEDYIRNMRGEDRDLAAHFTVINRYGVALCGEAVSDVFGEVPPGDYADSIWADIENAGEDIVGNTLYVTLNLCRVSAFLREGLCLSKLQGGKWGLENLPEKYHALISSALDCYGSNREMQADRDLAQSFAEYMLREIRSEMERYGIAAPGEF